MSLRSKRAFSLVELLVVVTILALLAAMLFPVYAQARRRALFSSATVSLRQIGVATAQYMADNDAHLPVKNWGYEEPWQANRSPRPNASDDPLAPYGAAGWNSEFRGIKESNNPMMCPGVNRAYTYRWVFSITDSVDPNAVPEEVRRIEPQPESVLVRCPNLLERGYSSGDFPTRWTSFTSNPWDRQGRELLLRGDGSVSNVDTHAERRFLRRPVDGEDTWKEIPTTTHWSDPGQPFEVFPNEPWPPQWTTIERPTEEKP